MPDRTTAGRRAFFGPLTRLLNPTMLKLARTNRFPIFGIEPEVVDEAAMTAERRVAMGPLERRQLRPMGMKRFLRLRVASSRPAR